MEELLNALRKAESDMFPMIVHRANAKAKFDEYDEQLKSQESNISELHDRINQELRQGDESVYFDKFEQDGATIKVRKLPASVLVQDVEQLPNDFVRVTKSADKKAIKTALDAGEEVEGAELSAETYKLEVSFDE